jgi:hypothetical protein
MRLGERVGACVCNSAVGIVNTCPDGSVTTGDEGLACAWKKVTGTSCVELPEVEIELDMKNTTPGGSGTDGFNVTG